MEFSTLKDFDLEGKQVLLRMDINSPIDPRTKEILDDTRIRSHVPTLSALRNSKVVVLAHQSRPGLDDFTTLEKHARKLEEATGRRTKYIDDVFGSAAKQEISGLQDGEILVLENVRFCSEEVSEEVTCKAPEEQAKTNLVRKLSSYVDFFVNDAFAVSHRSQPSVVAFPKVLPCCAGELMAREVEVLSKVLQSKESPRVFLFGGAKAGDAFGALKHVLERGIADAVLTSGMVANVFLLAEGADIGEANREAIVKNKMDSFVPAAKELLKKHGSKIRLPVDLAFQKNNSRVEASVKKLPNSKILDIGIETIASYANAVKEAKLVVANGPCGVFELSEFALGTEEMIKAIASSNAFSVIGGGHLSAIAQSMNLADSIDYISTGGKATMTFLAGEKLPGIEVLKECSRTVR